MRALRDRDFGRAFLLNPHLSGAGLYCCSWRVRDCHCRAARGRVGTEGNRARRRVAADDARWRESERERNRRARCNQHRPCHDQL